MSNERKFDRKSHPLPKGWVRTKLGEIISFKYGSGLPKNKREKGIVPVFGSNGLIGYHSQSLVDGHCLIIGRKGAIGRIHLSEKPCWPIDTTYFIKPPFELFIKCLFYFLKVLNLSNLDKSTAIPGLNRNDAYKLTIPLPPLHEQHRIVEKIEKVFSDLNAGVDALKKIKEQLKRYRQAVLKYAFEGKLTEEWREKHKDELEPALAFLDRIEENKRQNLNSQQKQVFRQDTTDLSNLPVAWAWAEISDVCNVKGRVGWRGYKKSDLRGNGPYVIGVKHLTKRLRVSLENPVYISYEKFHESPEIKIATGDIIIAQRGSLGKLAIVDFKLGDATINPCVLLLKNIRVERRFLLYLLASPIFQDFLLKGNTSTTTPMITQNFMKKLRVPLAPLFEQHRIVEEIEYHFSVADEIEKVVDQSLKQAERLRQSILKRAFEGKLVPQDPNDEPAAKLLERIKAKKAKFGKEKLSNKKWKRKTRQRRLL